jgi:hypothetical protein
MAVRQYGIPLDSREEWEQALRGVKHTFGHTWENCQAMHLTTGLKTYLYCFEKGDIRVVSPIAEREFHGHVDILKPYGFSGFVGNRDCPEFPRYWREFVHEREYVCGYLGLNPIFDYGRHFDPKEIYRYDAICVMDLNRSVPELLAGMSMGRRQQLRRWDEVSRDFVFDKSILAEFFLAHYYDFLDARGASSLYYFSRESLSQLLRSDNVMLVGAQHEGNVVAVNVFGRTPDAGDGLFAISIPEGRHYSAALIWYVAMYLKKLGIPVFNLGGAGGSIGDFKKRFGCRERPLKCVKQIYRPDLYKDLCVQVNADAADVSGYFPAYRREDLQRQNNAVG